MNTVEYAGEKLHKNIKSFYVASILKSIAITVPHTFLTLVFLDKGVSYSDIAIIQACYAAAIVIFEFPSGIIADKYDKKRLFLISNVLLLFSYGVVLLFNGLFPLMIAWFIYGVSCAIETGTLDAEIVVLIRKLYPGDEIEKELTTFLGKSGLYSSIASIIGAISGFFFYRFIKVNVYYLMLLLVLVSSIEIFFAYSHMESCPANDKVSTRGLIKNCISEMKNNKNIKWLVLLFALIQIFMQAHYQMWQSFFLENGLSEDWFLSLYLLFQIITIIVYKLPALQIVKNRMWLILLSGIISILAIFFARNRIMIIICYVIPVFLFSILQYSASIQYNKIVQENTISSLTSLTSTIMRLFGMISLLLISFTLRIASIKILFLIFPLVSLILSVLAIFGSKVFNY